MALLLCSGWPGGSLSIDYNVSNGRASAVVIDNSNGTKPVLVGVRLKSGSVYERTAQPGQTLTENLAGGSVRVVVEDEEEVLFFEDLDSFWLRY